MLFLVLCPYLTPLRKELSNHIDYGNGYHSQEAYQNDFLAALQPISGSSSGPGDVSIIKMIMIIIQIEYSLSKTLREMF
jgi:hypothetical protein